MPRPTFQVISGNTNDPLPEGFTLDLKAMTVVRRTGNVVQSYRDIVTGVNAYTTMCIEAALRDKV